jgi:hypothetical protein
MSGPARGPIIAAMSDKRLHCPVCDDVIGVYEPVVVIDQSRARNTSLANEPSLGHGEQIVMHGNCAHADGWDPPDA